MFVYYAAIQVWFHYNINVDYRINTNYSLSSRWRFISLGTYSTCSARMLRHFAHNIVCALSSFVTRRGDIPSFGIANHIASEPIGEPRPTGTEFSLISISDNIMLWRMQHVKNPSLLLRSRQTESHIPELSIVSSEFQTCIPRLFSRSLTVNWSILFGMQVQSVECLKGQIRTGHHK